MMLTENSIPKVLIDTNVIIDAISERDCDYAPSKNIIRLIVSKEIKGYISTNQITDIYYVLKKYIPNAEARRRVIGSILNTFEVVPALPSFFKHSLNQSKLDDYEDSIVEEVASVNALSFIITNNTKDYKNSKVIAITPKDYLKLFNI